MIMRNKLAIPFLLVALGALAQQPPAAQQASRAVGPAGAITPKSATHNGHPALEYEGKQGWASYIEYFEWQGEPALGFAMAQSRPGFTAAQPECPGQVYVTRTRVNGDFHGTKCDSFDLTRAGTTVDKQNGTVVLSSGSSTYTLNPIVTRGGEQRATPRLGAAVEFLTRAVNNFDRVYANIRRIGMEAQSQTAGQSLPPAPYTSAQPQGDKRGVLNITSDPGDVQVYINDEPRGMTSAEGHEVLRLPAGTYRLRLSQPGYKDFEQQVTLVSSKEQMVSAKLGTVGPPPFKAGDIVDLLQGKVSPKRIATLVADRGVDFEMDPDVEKRLRALGATNDLLLAIANNKKR